MIMESRLHFIKNDQRFSLRKCALEYYELSHFEMDPFFLFDIAFSIDRCHRRSLLAPLLTQEQPKMQWLTAVVPFRSINTKFFLPPSPPSEMPSSMPLGGIHTLNWKTVTSG